jgi:hypothetical protein
MDLESVLMFSLFLYSIKTLLHFLEPLLVLLLHLRSHGAAHLLLHLAQLVHHVLHLLLLRRGQMTLAHHLMHLTLQLVHHVHVLHPTLAHALAAHHVLAFAVHSPAMHLGDGNSGSHNQNYC